MWETDAWRIWEYKDVLPRAIFATGYVVKKNPQELVDVLYDTSTDLAHTVVLEEDPPVTPATGSVGKAEIISYGLNSVKVTTESDGDGFLLLTDNYYPGWWAAVDGQKTKVYRADYSFRAVFVPKGTHSVVFQYLPRSFMIGGAITLAGIILAFIL